MMFAMNSFSSATRLPFGMLLLLTLLSVVLATPVFNGNFSLSSMPVFEHELVNRADSFYLRIMPLGASITRGDPTAPGLNGRGYRKFLRDQLRFVGWKVNMVGSVQWGDDFDDNVSRVYVVAPSGRIDKNIHTDGIMTRTPRDGLAMSLVVRMEPEITPSMQKQRQPCPNTSPI